MQHYEYKWLEWHDSVWRTLWIAPAGLPHALLLAGPPGIGKRAFADALAARLVCEGSLAADAPACGRCPSCRWFAAGNHPDVRLVLPEAELETGTEPRGDEGKKASTQIRIEQIRALEDFVFVGGHRRGTRVVLIDPAEAMNAPAANSLLKILEEPPASVYFILVSTHWQRLLPTIRSRCRWVRLPRPGVDEAHAWLTGNGGAKAAELLPLLGCAPLLALEEYRRGRLPAILGFVGTLSEPGNDPLALAARWETHLQGRGDGGLSMETLVGLLQKWVFDLALSKVAGQARHHGTAALSRAGGRATASGLIRCYNELVKMRSLASHPLNPRLFLEEMATRYLRALAPDRGRPVP